MELISHLDVAQVKMPGAVPRLPLYAFVVYAGTGSTFTTLRHFTVPSMSLRDSAGSLTSLPLRRVCP